MKIAFLTKSVPPVIEGIGEYTFNLAAEFIAQGMDARLYTSEGQNQTAPWVYPVISKWEPKTVKQALEAFDPDWVSLQYVPQLYQRNGFCWAVASIPGYLKKQSRCKTSVTLHEFQTAFGFSPKKFIRACWLRLQTARILNGCDSAVLTCDSYKNILERAGQVNSLANIPVGATIMPHAFSNAEIEALKSKYQLGSCKVLGFLGRLASFRRLDAAIRILGEAKKKGIRAKLLLIGAVKSSNPSLYKELEDLAKSLGVLEDIVETKELPPEGVSGCLQCADIFLFPQQDGISTRNTTVMNALAHGLPILAYEPSAGNFDGYELPYGTLVKQGDEAGFILAALRLLQKNADFEAGAKQKLYFAEHFSWRRIALAYQKALDWK